MVTVIVMVSDISALVVRKHICGVVLSQDTHDALLYFENGSLKDLPYGH